jgi:uncharacterized protein (TIGR03118 family)
MMRLSPTFNDEPSPTRTATANRHRPRYAGRDARRRRRLALERLEGRTLPVSTLTISAANALTIALSTLDNDTVAVSFAAVTYTINDALDTIKVTNSGTATVTGANTHTVTVSGLTTPPLAFTASGGNGDTLALKSVGDDVTVADPSQGTVLNLALGNARSLQGLNGAVSVLAPSGTSGFVALTADDSADPTPRTVTLSGSTTLGALTGLGPQPIRFASAGLSALTINGGTGGNTYAVSNTPTNGANPVNTLNTGTGTNTVTVTGTAGALTVNDQGNDAVTVVTAGNAQGIKGAVTLTTSLATTALTVDDSADTANRAETLSASNGVGTLTGPAAVPVAFKPAGLKALTFLGGIGADTLTVDFSGGSPLPPAPAAFQYTGGPASDQDKNALVIQGGSFATETYTATGPGAGSIALGTGALINFSSLRPITDVAPVTGTYTFNAPPTPNILNVVNGPAAGLTEVNSAESPPRFEKVDFGNKAKVVVSALGGLKGANQSVTVNAPAQAAGLSALTIATGVGTNKVTVTATPPNVPVTVNAGGNDKVSVTACGLGSLASVKGAVDTVNAGPGTVTLNVDAGNRVATVLSTGPNSGTVSLANLTPGAPPPVLAFNNFGAASPLNPDRVNVTNAAELPLLPAAIPVAPVEGVPMTDVVVAKFTDRSHAVASNFTAGIAWGDGKTSAGTVVPDPALPGVFDVLGSHTYSEETTNSGSPPNVITVTVTDLGSTDQLLIGQTTVSAGVDVFVTDNGGAKAVAARVGPTSLVSDGAVPAAHSDPNLKGPWGVARDPSGNLVVADNATGLATEYDTTGAPLPTVITIPPPAGSPAGTTSRPMAVVVNTTTGFAVGGKPAALLFATQDGTISGWTSGPAATIAVDNSAFGAVYTGLAVIGGGASGPLLYAANFAAGRVEIYDASFNLVGQFTDPKAPAGFAPFGVKNVGGNLVVTYAQQNASKRDAAPAASAGLVDLFAPSGALISELVNGGVLNAPYGLALAPADFGPLAGDLIVGNLGDGRVNAFNPSTGAFAGTYADATLAPVSIPGLRDLAFGSVDGGLAGPISTLFAASGPNAGADGLLSSLSESPDLATVADAPLTAAPVAVPNPSTPPILQYQAFTADLATFTDANPNAVAGNFTATVDWGDGSNVSNGTVRLDASGVFHVAGTHTYTANGVYTVTVTVKDVGGSMAVIPTTAVIGDPPLSASAVNVPNSGTLPINENQSFTADVATFTDADPRAKAGDFAVTIDWGDGTDPATGTVRQQADGTFTVSGTHVYLAYGNYKVTVTIHDAAGGAVGGSVAVAKGLAAISDLPLNAVAVGVPNPGVLPINSNQAFTADVALFTDADTRAKAGDFQTSIDWGDGTLPSVGAVKQDGAGVFHVSGGHSYVRPGAYVVTVTILDAAGSDVGGSRVTVVSGAVIGDLPIVAAPLNVPNPAAPFVIEGKEVSTDVALFTDADLLARPGQFTALINWGDGSVASPGTISLDAGNTFHVTGRHTYVSTGVFPIGVTIRDISGGNTGGSVVFVAGTATVDGAVLTLKPAAVAATEGKAFNGQVATFTDANTNATPARFLATIDWGDGTLPDVVGVTQPGGIGSPFVVTGNHTYAEEGTNKVTVTVIDTTPRGNVVTDTATATVADAKLTGNSVPGLVRVLVGVFTAKIPVATFTDANPNATLDDFSATITWNDGVAPATTAGTITQPGGAGTPFVVTGDRNFPRVGLFKPVVAITDVGSAKANVDPGIEVDDDPLSAAGVATPFTAVEGKPFSGVVATVQYADPAATPGDVVATIDWGDGTQSAGDVTRGAGGLFSVAGSHTYSGAMTGTVTVSVQDEASIDASPGGNTNGTVTATDTITVADAPLSATGTVFFATEGTSAMGVVATFTDAALVTNPGKYMAVISWGDGTALDVVTPIAVGTSPAGTTFEVMGTHTYNDDDTQHMEVPGNQIVVVAIDPDGSRAVALSHANVTDPTILDPGVPVVAVEGVPFAATVSTFTDSNPHSKPSDFTATITWGDGQTSPGVVVADAPMHFHVVGAHRYARGGGYTVGVKVSDDEGQSVSDLSAAAVYDAPLYAVPVPVAARAGQAFAGPVAVFADGNPSSDPSPFLAQINWGDGSVTLGQVVPAGPGVFTILGQHTYARRTATVSAVVTVFDSGGSRATAVVPVSLGAQPAPPQTNPRTRPATVHAQSIALPLAHPAGPLAAAQARTARRARF